MIKKYSRKSDGEVELSENFTVIEFACKDGSDKILIDTKLIDVLQDIRNHFKKPVCITSAYRNESYNRLIGGVSNSQHILGTASDIIVEGIEPKKVAQYTETLLQGTGGIGLYENFVHIDTRLKRARWENYGKEVAVNGFYAPSYLSATDAVSVLVKKGIINEADKWSAVN